ncbi:MAG: GHKL domain-containing protein [Clostridia bacterium]|nr:GHKL domain-containing protein [Clostridia bacterium]
MVVKGTALFIQANILKLNILNSYYISNTVVHCICFVLLCPFLIILLKKTTSKIFEVSAPKLWETIWLLPLFTTIIVLIFTYDLSQENVAGWQFITARLVIVINMLLIYGVLLNSLKNIKEQTILKEKSIKSQQLLAMYTNQYNLLQKHILETRRAKHDLRQHINLIQTYIDKKDTLALSEYIKKYGKTLPNDISSGYCQNYAIDVIIGYYAQIAKENNIKFSSNIQLPPDINIPDPTLCILFGNLLENAVEACKNFNKSQPFIKICSTIIGENSLSVTMDNSSDKPPSFSDGKLLSTKHNGIGMGTYSVIGIAEEYNGIAEFDYKDNIFYTSVFISIP